MRVLNRPIISEKTLEEAKGGRFAFRVNKKATKTQIKDRVEKQFGVKVLSVQTITVKGKSYRTGKRWVFAKRPDGKKAVVKLQEGQKIDLFDLKTE